MKFSSSPALLAFAFAVISSHAQPSPPVPAASTPAVSSAAAAAPVSDSPAITDPLHDPLWHDLFAQLAPARSRLAQFEEKRFFPFRTEPTVLTGEIRLMPGHGLSLHYVTPAQSIVIVDAQGVLLRDQHGRERAAPNDSRAQAVSGALFDVLRFDVAALRHSFALRGRRDGSRWTLVFAPRDTVLSDLIGDIAVSGHDALVDRIVLEKSARQRIEISLHDTRENLIFGADVLDRYFR